MSTFLVEEGAHYGDFFLVKYKPIQELQIILRELIHLPSGAQVMHIENDDTENLFCLSFQTFPSSSNGAAHVLEHTVLCGSRKFPVKDPFFSMGRRSLNTFMNALTGSDFTCYPAATQVEKDFYNLLEVYLDAVFHPLLKEVSFWQEGHRLEFTRPEDIRSPLEIKGIVYNEMKGSLSSIESHIWQAMIGRLVPDLPYSYNSGGEPREIPKLTYRDLIEFYETYYHPSRCLFYFYGNLPLRKHLDFLSENALKKVQRLSPLPELPTQRRFEKSLAFTESYPLSESQDLSKQYIHGFGWLTTHLQNQEEVLALIVLDSILMDTDASLLRKAFEESGLCVQADSALDTEMREVPFLFFCRGCKEEDGPALKKILLRTLRRVAKRGIPFSLVESSLHQLEFSHLEINRDQGPFGLTLFMRAALAKQQGCSPERALALPSLLSSLLEKARDPYFFRPLIEKYFLQNSHLVEMTFVPDLDFVAKEIQRENEDLRQRKERLTEKEIVKILDQTRELANYQEQLEGQRIDCLPKVLLGDVQREVRDFPLKIDQVGDLKVFHSTYFTNQVLYADLLFDLPELAKEELFVAELFIILWSELGAANRNYQQNLAMLHANTGGLSANCSLFVQATNPIKTRPALQISGKTLYRKLPEFFHIFHDMVRTPRVDEKKRIEELILKLAHSMQNRLARSAMRYASQMATSSFTIPSYIHEEWHGLTFYQKVQKLAGNLSQELPKLLEQLEELKHRLFTMPHPHLVLTCNEEIFREIEKHQFFGLSHLPSHLHPMWKASYALPVVPSQARLLASPVASTAYAIPTVSYSHSAAPALLISSLLLGNKVLHHRIREQGGAYGAGVNYNPLWGYFSFYAYRDPHIARSLHTFKNSIDEMADGNFDDSDLEEAKLSIIQHLDVPLSPGSRAIAAYTWQRSGKTNVLRQHFRDRLLALSKEELQAALKEHVQPKKELGTAVTFADQALIEKENALLALEGKQLQVLPIMT